MWNVWQVNIKIKLGRRLAKLAHMDFIRTVRVAMNVLVAILHIMNRHLRSMIVCHHVMHLV